jgi:hypothetical protein
MINIKLFSKLLLNTPIDGYITTDDHIPIEVVELFANKSQSAKDTGFIY